MNDTANTSIKTIIIIVSILLLVVGYWDPFEKSATWWWVLLPKIGEMVIIGGIIGFISNESTILNNYRKELTDALICKNHLDERKDIRSIWENVSKAMFKSKFPKIHADLLKTIQLYLPTNAVSYYDNYEITTRIELLEGDKLKIIDEAEFDLIAESKDKFTFEQDNWVVSSTEFDFELRINGKPVEVKSEKENNKNITHYVCRVPLKGHNEYHIEKKVTKVYSLIEDNYVAFRAKYITNNFKVTFVIPKEIKLELTERGTLMDFKEKRIDKTTTVEYSYNKGIILPRQGFVAILSKRNRTNQKTQDEKILSTPA